MANKSMTKNRKNDDRKEILWDNTGKQYGLGGRLQRAAT
jgi:hypothetical protein